MLQSLLRLLPYLLLFLPLLPEDNTRGERHHWHSLKRKHPRMIQGEKRETEGARSRIENETRDEVKSKKTKTRGR
jgi:hypothetical protein